MKIAIVGSREFRHIDLARDIICKFLINSIPEAPTENELYLISGGAIGIDTLAEKIADRLKIEKIIFKPDWNTYGKRAAAIRNQKIVDTADMILSFWNGIKIKSGTWMTINMAIKAGKPINIYVRP